MVSFHSHGSQSVGHFLLKGKLVVSHKISLLYLPTYLPACLPAYLPVYLSAYLPAYLSIYLPTYLPTTYLPPTYLLHIHLPNLPSSLPTNFLPAMYLPINRKERKRREAAHKTNLYIVPVVFFLFEYKSSV